MELRSLCENLLDRIAGARVGVLGDLVLDAYWELDPAWRERSLETGLPVRRVSRARYSPGAAGNVMLALARLGVPAVRAFGVCGGDVFGRLLLESLRQGGIDTDAVVVVPDRPGAVYAKSRTDGVESERFDFGMSETIEPPLMQRAVDTVIEALPALDVLVVNQQVEGRIASVDWINGIADGASARGVRVILDTRHLDVRRKGIIRKWNESEARRFLRACGEQVPADPCDVAMAAARTIAAPVVMTRGRDGIVASDGDGSMSVPGIPLTGPVDPVGAGDTVVAVLAAGIAVGESLERVLPVANLAAAHTATRLAGTESPDRRELADFAARQVPV